MALDILNDNWGPYTHTEVENALKAYLTVLEGRINQAIQEGGVGLTDLSQEVQALLNKANTALQPENIAAWAKAQDKPGYTASEITGVTGFQNLLAKLQDMDQKIQAAAQSGGVDPDDEMSSTSENVVQNKVIKAFVETFVTQAVSNLINGAPAALDTLKELADKLGDNDDAIAALITAIASKISGIRANGASNTLPVDQNGVVELPPSSSGENNVQSDWAETDTTDAAYIQNKPDLTLFATKTELNGKQDKINDIASIRANSGKGVADMSSNEDGTVVYILANGDTYTLDLNHEHPQYQPLLTAGTNITIATNPQTGKLEISASGGNSGGITGITMNDNNVSVSGGVANLGTVITAHQDISGKANASEMAVSTSGDQTTITLKTGTSATVINQHQSLSGRVQSNDVAQIVVLADEAAYRDLPTKDSSTLYLIKESNA